MFNINERGELMLKIPKNVKVGTIVFKDKEGNEYTLDGKYKDCSVCGTSENENIVCINCKMDLAEYSGGN